MQRSNSLHLIARSAALALSFVAILSAGSLQLAHADTPPASPNTTGNVTGKGSVQTGNTTGNVPSATTNGTLQNPLKYNDLNSLLAAVLKALITIGSIFLTIMIVVVGFRFVNARGNEEKISSARSALLWTVIGGLILLGATAIQAVITSTVNNITT